MQVPLVNQINISREQVLCSANRKEYSTISPNIISQIQFLINRTDELKTVLNEVDEILKRLKEEALKNFFSEGDNQ